MTTAPLRSFLAIVVLGASHQVIKNEFIELIVLNRTQLQINVWAVHIVGLGT
jgi:hypothetical protein